MDVCHRLIAYPHSEMWTCLFLSIFATASAKMTGFIVGGKRASIEDWPFIVFQFTMEKGQPISSCGGSLISSQTVLTAAHCLDDNTAKKKEFGKISFVILMGHEEYAKSTMSRNVTDYKTPSTYDPDGTNFDLGVVFLDRPVSFSKTVKKVLLIPMPLNADMVKSEDLAVAGWGSTGDTEDNGSPYLKMVEQAYMKQSDCFDYMYDGNDRDLGVICAGKSKEYAYSGDSGGPLVLTRNETQVGIVSYRMESQGITVYTSVAHYYRWIEAVQKKLFTEQCSHSQLHEDKTTIV